jgi:hypothetical protein
MLSNTTSRNKSQYGTWMVLITMRMRLTTTYVSGIAEEERVSNGGLRVAVASRVGKLDFAVLSWRYRRFSNWISRALAQVRVSVGALGGARQGIGAHLGIMVPNRVVSHYWLGLSAQRATVPRDFCSSLYPEPVSRIQRGMRPGALSAKFH